MSRVAGWNQSTEEKGHNRDDGNFLQQKQQQFICKENVRERERGLYLGSVIKIDHRSEEWNVS